MTLPSPLQGGAGHLLLQGGRGGGRTSGPSIPRRPPPAPRPRFLRSANGDPGIRPPALAITIGGTPPRLVAILPAQALAGLREFPEASGRVDAS